MVYYGHNGCYGCYGKVPHNGKVPHTMTSQTHDTNSATQSSCMQVESDVSISIGLSTTIHESLCAASLPILHIPSYFYV